MHVFDDILVDLENKNKEYERLCELLTFEEIMIDKKLYLHINNQKNIIEDIVLKYRQYLKENKELIEIKKIINSFNKDDKSFYELELENEIIKVNALQEELKKMYFLIEAKNENILIEIIKSKDELSSLLAEKITSAYENFCKNNSYKFFAEFEKNKINISVSGLNAKKIFEEEIGQHYAKKSSLNGSCQVFVYDSINLSNYDFNENELEIIACRSSGAGGQHINTTDSSIKITHLPTGISAISQDERSQFQNKQKALERLKNKVNIFLKNKKEEMLVKQKKEQVNKMKITIKTYDFENEEIISIKGNLSLEDFINGKQLI